MGKLVRDRIPSIIRAAGQTPITRVLDPDEYRTELLAKLIEEAEEARAADSEHLLEELGDVLEVMRSLLIASGWGWEDIELAAGRKRAARGGFTERTYLET